MSPRACTVCTHAEREAIDAAIVSGEPNRRVATRYRLSEAAVRRHRDNHISAALALAAEASGMVRADDLLQQVADLQTKAYKILAKAEKAGELRTCLLAIREAARCLELQAKMIAAALALAPPEPPRVTVEAIDAEIARLNAELEALGVDVNPLDKYSDAEIARMTAESLVTEGYHVVDPGGHEVEVSDLSTVSPDTVPERTIGLDGKTGDAVGRQLSTAGQFR